LANRSPTQTRIQRLQPRDFVTALSSAHEINHRSRCRQHRDVTVSHVSQLARAGRHYTTENELDIIRPMDDGIPNSMTVGVDFVVALRTFSLRPTRSAANHVCRVPLKYHPIPQDDVGRHVIDCCVKGSGQVEQRQRREVVAVHIVHKFPAQWDFKWFV